MLELVGIDSAMLSTPCLGRNAVSDGRVADLKIRKKTNKIYTSGTYLVYVPGLLAVYAVKIQDACSHAA